MVKIRDDMDKIWALLLISILLGACDNRDSTRTTNISPDALVGQTYSGITPCADCEGIFYKLSLREGQRFEERSIYIGESNRPFTDTGSYTIQDDTLLILEGENKKATRFAIEDSVLVMLDQKGERITGSLADHYVLDREEPSADRERGQWSDLRDQGVDFRATGNEPFWNIQIDFDKEMRFSVLDGDSIRMPVPEMEQDTSSSARLLEAEAESGAVNVALYPTGCMDTMSGEVFTHRVVVETGKKTFYGCGNYINDRFKLHDFWVLHSLNGTPLNQQDTLRQQPALQFDLTKNSVAGNTGCNQLGGTVSVRDDSLSFSQLITTKMACEDMMELESQFLNALSEVNRFHFSNEDLFLFQDEDTLMILRRTE